MTKVRDEAEVFFKGTPCLVPDGTVGVDDYSRYVARGGEALAVEFYPWPWRAPVRALRAAVDVLEWHVRAIEQYGLRGWRELRRL